MLLLLSLPVWALFLETLVIEGLSTGFLSRASAIILLIHVAIISGENSQNFVISGPVAQLTYHW